MLLTALLSGPVVFATQQAQPQSTAVPPEPTNLKSRADAAQGSEKISLSLEFAHRELEHANALYTAGDPEKGQAEVDEVMIYVRRAVEQAIATNKKLKPTEIDLRKLQHRMRDIGASLDIDDRPPVEKSVTELEQLRASLLSKMFGDKAEPKEKSQ